MKVTKPGTVEVSEDKVVINNFDFETEDGDLEASYYKAALAACEWAKAEMDKSLKELFESDQPKDKIIHLNSIDDLDIVDECYRLDPTKSYVFDNPIVLSERPEKDNQPYYRKFERNKRN